MTAQIKRIFDMSCQPEAFIRNNTTMIAFWPLVLSLISSPNLYSAKGIPLRPLSLGITVLCVAAL